MLRPTQLVFLLATSACAASTSVTPTPDGLRLRDQIVLNADVVWEPLNPARGDKSPMAANLWGDRTQSGPTGFLVKFIDGFASPPHIHNVSYRGVVIRGLIHNDEADAEEVWMPVGSFWTQPKGGPHITAARGPDVMAYIEIDDGPYLVRPVDQAFSTDEVPVNLVASKIDWADVVSSDVSRVPGPAGSTPLQVAGLWGDGRGDEPRGMMVQVAGGSAARVAAGGQGARIVVIQGQVEIGSNRSDATTLTPGSYLGLKDRETQVACEGSAPCMIYVHAKGSFVLTPVDSSVVQG